MKTILVLISLFTLDANAQFNNQAFINNMNAQNQRFIVPAPPLQMETVRVQKLDGGTNMYMVQPMGAEYKPARVIQVLPLGN